MSDKKQLARKLLELAYAENHVENLIEQTKAKQAHKQVELNEVELNNPTLMLQKGYAVTQALNKPEQTTINFAAQPDQDAEIAKVKARISYLKEATAKLESL